MAAPSPGPREVLAPSPEAGCRAVTSSRRGLLWRLRDKQSRLGLFEISPGHELHGMTCMMQAGLWAATQVSMDHPPTGPPSRDDFSEVLTQVHEGFELGTLAGPAFAWLRRSLGLAEEDYQAALGPGGPYLQFLSTSKSKASFFLSHDQRFFLKTQGRREVQALLAHLPRYVQHLQRHPHSLLARLLGMHSLRVDRGKKTYFIVMQSVFYPASRISERYDIKGCEVSRWVDPAPEGSPLVLVLKDLNFQGKTINLGPQRSWFLRQMELDTTFLRELNVLDYSLLIAFQCLHEDERGPGSSLIFRTARTLRSSSLAPSSCLHLSSGLCKGHRARKSRQPKTAGCCPTPPTPYTSWTGPSSAISWASWISPRSTGSASGWSTCGRHCATRAGPSPLSARLATPVASASGWRRTRSDGSPAPLSGSG
ncbi:phosphatidylinositol 4-phosphate 5-kinase-like protein 1 isoform X1 [Gorilla gorilla gorilla]|uniref:phosphatidylinositol 4-phosphate 5-kinase-like protein 1 isoform X1 n=1 Tax=Gorilla gorilla gorilla TaxID=9595 RepID=UPI002445990D|nr:phosphatidylinositol 4-phosphate 5-kinase-like protein 1 isoform X1 [Gorilla gorilla gorilla]